MLKEIAQLLGLMLAGAKLTARCVSKAHSQLVHLDTKYKLRQTALLYLHDAGKQLHASAGVLKHTGLALKGKTEEASKACILVIMEAPGKFEAALIALFKCARSCDQKVRAVVVSSISTIAVSTHKVAASSMEIIGSSIESLQLGALVSASIICHAVKVGAAKAIASAMAVDEKIGLSRAVSGAAMSVGHTIAEADGKFGIASTLSKVDQQVSGGLVERCARFVLESVSRLMKTEPTAQHAPKQVKAVA